MSEKISLSPEGKNIRILEHGAEEDVCTLEEVGNRRIEKNRIMRSFTFYIPRQILIG